MTDSRVRDALRMMGHLLETNGVTGSKAMLRDGTRTGVYNNPKACKWCLVGATDIVFDKLFRPDVVEGRYALVESHLGLSHDPWSLSQYRIYRAKQR